MERFIDHLLESMRPATVKKKFSELEHKISRHKHQWGPNPPLRLMKWVDEYDSLKSKYPKEFESHCKETGTELSSNGHDLLA